MAKRLLENIYQVGGSGLTHELDGASYLLHDERQPENSVLIDCGSHLGIDALTHQLGSIGLRLGDVAAVFATHCHYDHVSAATAMEQTALRIHDGDIDAVKDGNNDLTASFLYDYDFPPVTSAENLEDGYELEVGATRLQAIHTPGHTPGSMSYKLVTPEASILIAGDTLWGGCEQRIKSDLDAWSTSLERLQGDSFDFLTFGHGVDYLVPNAMAHIDKAQSRFYGPPRPSHGGLYMNPWADTPRPVND